MYVLYLFIAPCECKKKFLKLFFNKNKLLLNMCSLCGFSQGLAVASALVDISQQMPIVYKEKSGAVRNRKQQPPAQPGTCIWCWGQDSLWARSGVPEPSAEREQARRHCAGQKTGNSRNIHLICMFTSFLWRFLPSVLQHLTFYFHIGNNWFSYRSRGDPVVAGGGRCRASERARNDTQVHVWKTVLGTVSTVQKTKM